MAEIVIKIPDAKLNRVVDGVCGNFGYQENVPDPDNDGEVMPNPQTKGQFAKAQIVKYTKDCVRAYEYKVSEATERSRVNQEVDDIGIS